MNIVIGEVLLRKMMFQVHALSMLVFMFMCIHGKKMN